jgi:3-oxoacyl-[acyl-carrier-protein] synthase III
LRIKEDENIHDFFIDSIPGAVDKLLALEGLNASQIAIVLGPQLSPDFTTRLSTTIQISRERFVDIATAGKDLFTSSLAYSLQCANTTDILRPGDIGLIISVGSGIQVGCAIYYF